MADNDQEYKAKYPDYAQLGLRDIVPEDDEPPPEASRNTASTANGVSRPSSGTAVPKTRIGSMDRGHSPSQKVAFDTSSLPAGFLASGGPLSTCRWSGKSWVFTSRDIESGLITRFTQTPGSRVGTLEIIVADPVDINSPEAAFLTAAERNRQPRKSIPNATLPFDMQKDVMFSVELAERYGPQVYELPVYHSSLEALVPDPVAVRAVMRQERIDAAARLNAQEARKRQAENSKSDGGRPTPLAKPQF